MLNFNPFGEYGIADYSQYKKYPFLQTESNQRIQKTINSHIEDNFSFPERLLILGIRGIGKTTSLFNIRDILVEQEKTNVFLFSRLISDNKEFFDSAKITLEEASKNPTFILIDFPDSPQKQQFKSFLEYIWNLMVYRNYQNIHFIFALNISIYDQSITMSEVLGKFHKFRLEKLNKEESVNLIKSRLELANDSDFFDEEVYDVIYDYSNGIPRNIVCASRTLVDIFRKQKKVSVEDAKKTLKEDYIQQIINDRVEDNYLRLLYKKIMDIIANDFGGEVLTQEKLVDKINEETSTGRNRCIKLINQLVHYGLLNLTKGGRNNTQKILKTI